ncbi:MAG: ketoacyl-ACP synthase III [Acidimicrobiia bacterium]|nr:ketoacyl-ACP synthase III [Acidimicrobiia bacterium]MYB24053.1 ketoacyl-ACP synthase III [Acidimicrobiia bacterium]
MSRGSRIIGYGTALPDRVITNHDLAQTLDTSDTWITERTGIKERRIGGTTRALGIEAARKALEMAGVEAKDLDGVILATTTPDRVIPATASSVQLELGARCGAFDLNAACSGFVYGLNVAHGLILAGADQILLVGSETLSRFVDWEDRATAVLFGDGAGAVVLSATDAADNALLGWALDCKGEMEKSLHCDFGGFIHMDGREVFRQAVRIMVETCDRALAAAGLRTSDVALVIPHQANIRIIQSACEKLGIAEDRTVQVLSWTGNTSSASIPLALADAADSGRLAAGDIALMVGFGAGMTSASALLRWSL